MDAQEIEALLRESIDLTEVHVKLDGNNVNIIAVSPVFEGMSRVKQHQLVYAPLKNAVADGTLHAVSIKPYTPEKWRKDKLLQPAP